MKVSVNWLKKYIDINLNKLDELLHQLTLGGTEVESYYSQGSWEGIFVAEVKKISKHPNADRLNLVEVDDRGSIINVVCGANNLYENQKVAFAPVGSKLLNPKSNKMESLKQSKIRGEISNGMICSALELGLGDDHKGILDLDKDTAKGTDLKKIFNDVIINLELTPNRPDCLGVYGVAREISALTRSPLKPLEIIDEYDQSLVKDSLSLDIEAPDLCYRYMGVVISDIKIQESPEWLKNTLISIGEKPINNIVDITNYVMFEIGQPLHAFDYSKVGKNKIIARRSKKDEKITTLDGTLRILDEDILVIADDTKPMAVAGIKGGLDSGISENTKSIVLESACFQATNNRNTASKLDLKSQATLRFEKNLTPELCEVAFKRAIFLIEQIAGGKISSKVMDIGDQNKKHYPVKLSSAKLESVLGINLNQEKVSEILKNLGFKFKTEEDKMGIQWVVEKSFWRPDINIEEDLCEEIARIEGYESIPSKLISGSIPAWNSNGALDFNESIKDIMVSMGYFEVINYSADSESNLKLVSNIVDNLDLIKIKNPISKEVEFMKSTLKSGILKSLSFNLKNSLGNLMIFELGTVFSKKGSNNLPSQSKYLCCGIAGDVEKSIWEEERPVDIYDAKRLLEGFFKELSIDFNIIPHSYNIFTQGKGYKILINKLEVGDFGEVSKKVSSEFQIKNHNVILIDLNLEKIFKNFIPKSEIKYKTISKYPVSIRDISLIIDEEVFSEKIITVIENFDLVRNCEAVDIYEGESMEKNKKSLTIRITYGSQEKTLSGKEIDICESNILKSLENNLEFSLRK